MFSKRSSEKMAFTFDFSGAGRFVIDRAVKVLRQASEDIFSLQLTQKCCFQIVLSSSAQQELGTNEV